jgi:multidrug efflux system membrane fusion protein
MNNDDDAEEFGPSGPASAPARPKRPRGRIIFAALGSACLLVPAGWFLRSHLAATAQATQAGAEADEPGETVRAARVSSGELPIIINALGTVTPYATVTVRTQIAGKLLSVGFEEGQNVKAGDFLAQIDPQPIEMTLAQARSQLAKDQALLEQARVNLARYQTLGKSGSIAQQQIDDQTFIVSQYRATLDSDQTQIDSAKLNLAYAHIVSPIDGRAGFRLVDTGNYLQPSDANGLVVITQLDPISVFFPVAEDKAPEIVARLKAGAILPVTALDRSGLREIATGTLATFDNQIDRTTGTLKLRAKFANSDGKFFPNQFVNIRVQVDTLSGVALVPNAALQLGSIGAFVYVIGDKSRVSVRKIEMGPAGADHTMVASGLAVGERVVIEGADRLRDGASVKVLDDATVAQRP